VAGTPGATIKGNIHQGAAYVFVEPSGGWANMTQTAKLTASAGAASDNLGSSVGIDGNTVVAGPYAFRVPAYVFVKPAAGWADVTETAKLTASDQATVQLITNSVAVSGNTVVVGKPPCCEAGNPYLGTAYVFVEPPSGWVNMT